MANISLYLDECVDVHLAYRLQNQSYDAIPAKDLSNLGKKDEEQLELAINYKRAILTHNEKDFVHLHREFVQQRRYHYGVIISGYLHIDELERRILKLFRCLATHSQMENKLVRLYQFR